MGPLEAAQLEPQQRKVTPMPNDTPIAQRRVDAAEDIICGANRPWTAPPTSDEQFRAAGYTASARNYPLSAAAARWVAEFNGIPFDKIPPAWCYAPNPYMLTMIEEAADRYV